MPVIVSSSLGRTIISGSGAKMVSDAGTMFRRVREPKQLRALYR
jgi:hypothetical protein